MTGLNKSRALTVRLCAPILLSVLIVGFYALPTVQVSAQALTTLYRFHGSGADGGFPVAGLILSSNTLYGTSPGNGDIAGNGIVFALNTTGTTFTVLHSFTPNPSPFYTNSDGALPFGGLILISNTLYGTTQAGGSSGNGTVFKVKADGTGFTNLHSFSAGIGPRPNITNSDGALPEGTLVISGNTLYGTAIYGGSSGSGTLFGVNTDGTGFTTLHSFAATSGFSSPTNSDGAWLRSGLILSGTTLYGTAEYGGSSADGTVFAISTNGTGFTILHSFSGTDGAGPCAALTLSDDTLYGTTTEGGGGGSGTVFALNTDGTGFTNLYSFTTNSFLFHTNIDGAFPYGGLILTNNTLYGTATGGGGTGKGTIFSVSINGTGFTVLHIFNEKQIGSGVNPQGGVILSGNTFYGTTYETSEYGGIAGYGTVFSISFEPHLSIVPADASVVLSWPTNYAGFDYSGYTLHSTTNLASPAIWTTNPPAPVVINGQFAVTNRISGTQQFFRLSR
jgi:uncharacterized repeat protein (TIGR03803 family)